MKILFICVGNTCRSPMAMCIARSKGYEARSAGISVHNEGAYASRYAKAVMYKRGLSLDNHQSHQIVEEDLIWPDRILCMTNLIREKLLCSFSVIKKEIVTFTPSIPDPYGCGEEEYEYVARLIEKQVDDICIK